MLLNKKLKKLTRKLARENHPDLNPNNSEAEKRFKEISEAHAVIGDERKRQEYDQIEQWVGSGFGGFNKPRKFIFLLMTLEILSNKYQYIF